MNVTAVNPAAPGYLTVFPCRQDTPTASNLNFPAHKTIPNLAIAKIGSDGEVCSVSNTTTDLVLDVAGWFPAGSSYVPVPSPVRVLDSRIGQGAPRGACTAGAAVAVDVSRGAGIPAGASAVAINITAVNPAGSAYVPIIANDLPRGPVVVDISGTDAGFDSSDCGTWTP
jgi:hypothetical protein